MAVLRVLNDLSHDVDGNVDSKDGERTELETDGSVPLRVVIDSPAAAAPSRAGP